VRDLLVNADLPVQQITCGFSRAENLIRFFRDAYGSPPTAYRSKHGTRPQAGRA
jgi:transcriptional regulator GlxA family with amidase domain